MHASVAAQERLHARAVTAMLGRTLGGAPPIEPIVVGAGAPFAYRSRARLALRARPGEPARVGYRGARSHRIVPVTACAVLRPELEAVLGDLARLLTLGARGEGEAEAALGADARPVVELSWSGELGGRFLAELAALVPARWAGARIWLEGARAPASFGDPRPVVPGAEGAPLRVAPGGFAQPSHEGGVALARCVADLAGDAPGNVVELFAGSGTLTVLLARAADRLLAVEQDPGAVTVLRDNLRSRALEARVRETDANAMALPAHTDTVVLDPPRVGAAGATRHIARARPRRVVYVSCWLPTQARDLAALRSAGYRLDRVALVELFPQTSHVEVVARLIRGEPARLDA
jgi:23S rRNA (uracil1939-C5)-methyltransferase